MPDTTVLPLNDEIRRVADEAMRAALQHIENGEFDQAATLCRAVLEIAPGYAQAHYRLGLLEWQVQRLREAAAHLSAALQADAGEAAYWLAYIEVLLDGAELRAARETIGLGKRNGLRGAALDALAQRLARAERGSPSRKETDTLTALLNQRRLDEAEHMARVMTIDCPRHGFGWKSLGAAFHMRGQLVPAVEAMARSVECDPGNAEALSNFGVLLKESRRHDDALICLREALELDPKRADTYNNMAVTLLDMNRLAEAEASARAAVALDPKNAEAWNTLGATLLSQGRMAGAIDAYRHVLRLEPGNASVHSNILFSMSQVDGISAAELFAEHLRFAERIEAPLRKKWRAHANDRDPQRALRVGFVSADLRNHAVASFIEPIFERLVGRPGVSLHAYHNYVTADHVSDRLRGYMAQWTEVVGLDDDALAERIRADGIDILVDLSGHTGHNRLPVLARKPAPVQVSWIGYPGTTGLQSVDYYLTDRHLVPPGRFDHQFTEKLAYLPVSAPFQPEQDAPAVHPLPALANGYITFGSFNRISKIGRKVVAAWAPLLRALPDSQLLLGGVPPDGATQQILAWLAEEGVDAARVRVHPRCETQEYLGLHNQVDICLDAFPYSGGTTTLHALWMGVPTLTLGGDTAAGRQTVCILEQKKLPQFIALDSDDFLRKGLALCSDLEALADLRAGMRLRFAMPSSDYMTRIADALENALRTMWQRWCDGLPAASFEVAAKS
jgi:predicted O-linked N-acetylglucosamine transferase (SPINDLY family)